MVGWCRTLIGLGDGGGEVVVLAIVLVKLVA